MLGNLLDKSPVVEPVDLLKLPVFSGSFENERFA
jgi:hypothetical protein